MEFKERFKVSEEVIKFFDDMDKKLKAAGETEIQMGRDVFGVVQALDKLGYLYKSECRDCKHFGGMTVDCMAPSLTPCPLEQTEEEV